MTSSFACVGATRVTTQNVYHRIHPLSQGNITPHLEVLGFESKISKFYPEGMETLLFQLLKGVSGKSLQFGYAHFLTKTLQLIFNSKFWFLVLHFER